MSQQPLFAGIANAPIFERGKFILANFDGELVLKKTIVKQTFKSGIAFIAELEVTVSNHPNHPVGDKVTWFQGMKNQAVAFSAIKGFVAGLLGIHTDDANGMTSLAQHIEPILNEATQNPLQNQLINRTVHLVTRHTLTQQGNDFTIHIWTPMTGQAGPQAAAVAAPPTPPGPAPVPPQAQALPQAPPGTEQGWPLQVPQGEAQNPLLNPQAGPGGAPPGFWPPQGGNQ